MGKLMIDMYEEAKNLGNLNAQIRLAILTSIPLNKAKELPDNQDNLTAFKKAMEIVRKEYK